MNVNEQVAGRGRILVSNVLSPDRAAAGVAAGEWSPQQNWGTDELERAGWSLDRVPRPKSAWLMRVSRALRMQLGDIALQARILRRARGAALILALEPSTVRALCIARQCRLLRIPLVVVVHPTPPRSWIARFALRGPDHVIALSSAIAEQLVQRGRDRSTTTSTWWGPAIEDARYESTATPESIGVVMSGQTHRDFETLLTATEQVGADLTVVLREGKQPSALLSRVRVVVSNDHHTILHELRRAAAVAIPLARIDGTFGVTELSDALALGKPVVMTRNPYVDLPIAASGAGIEVALRDVAGWASALQEILGDPTRRQEMGSAGRELIGRHDYGAWSRHMVEVVTAVAQPRTP